METNSLIAFQQYQPQINKSQRVVWECILENNRITAEQIALKTGMKINVVGPRLNELMYEKQIIKVCFSRYVNNYPQSVYGVRNMGDDLNRRKLSKKDIQIMELKEELRNLNAKHLNLFAKYVELTKLSEQKSEQKNDNQLAIKF